MASHHVYNNINNSMYNNNTPPGLIRNMNLGYRNDTPSGFVKIVFRFNKK